MNRIRTHIPDTPILLTKLEEIRVAEIEEALKEATPESIEKLARLLGQIDDAQ